MTTDREIAVLADAICRLLEWQRIQAELKERQKFKRRLKKVDDDNGAET